MNKGNTMLILIAVLAVLLLGFLWFTKGGTQKQVSEAPQYQSVSDLDTAAKELDGTNLNQMDTDLNQIASDSSGF